MPTFPISRHARVARAARRGATADLVPVSGLLGRRVHGLDRATRPARLVDVVVRFATGVHPPVTGIVVRTAGGDRRFVPIDRVDALAPASVRRRPRVRRAAVAVRGGGTDRRARADEVALAAELIDRQIVDAAGTRLVRSSDLYLVASPRGWRLVGVDVGLRALARRLGPPGRRTRVTGGRVLDWRLVDDVGPAPGATVHLRARRAELARLRPADLAAALAPDTPTGTGTIDIGTDTIAPVGRDGGAGS